MVSVEPKYVENVSPKQSIEEIMKVLFTESERDEAYIMQTIKLSII